MSVVALMLVAAVMAADACEPPGQRDRSPCSGRVGHCFDLTIDGQPVVPLDDASLASTLQSVASQSICWMLAAPVQGALEPLVQPNGQTTEHLGALYDEVEIVVTALEGQEIPTRKGIRTDPTVRIGGVPMQTAVDVIDVEALPDGAYIATFRVRGPGGWDRKGVYLTVARTDDP